jgi:hypothetical protein
VRKATYRDLTEISYRPAATRKIFSTASTIRDPTSTAHGRRLAGLAGRTLHHVWLVWDLRADEWFTDCLVVLDFGDEHVEINHQKFDDLSSTFNSIDPRQTVT